MHFVCVHIFEKISSKKKSSSIIFEYISSEWEDVTL